MLHRRNNNLVARFYILPSPGISNKIDPFGCSPCKNDLFSWCFALMNFFTVSLVCFQRCSSCFFSPGVWNVPRVNIRIITCIIIYKRVNNHLRFLRCCTHYQNTPDGLSLHFSWSSTGNSLRIATTSKGFYICFCWNQVFNLSHAPVMLHQIPNVHLFFVQDNYGIFQALPVLKYLLQMRVTNNSVLPASRLGYPSWLQIK